MNVWSIIGWAWLAIVVAAPITSIALAGYKHQRDYWDADEIVPCIAAGFLTALTAPLVVTVAALAGIGYLIFGGGSLLAKRIEARHRRKLDRLASDAEAIRRTRDMFDVESFTWTVLNDEYREAEAARREACQS